MHRHFTVSGFLVEGESTLLHWHKKLQIWLPPGGHIDPDEDPVQAVVREVLEETGITAEVVPHMPDHAFSNVAQLPSPLSIIVATVGATPEEPEHQHIDMCYALRPVDGAPRVAAEADHGFISVSADQLRTGEDLATGAGGAEVPVPEDVRVLGLRSIALVRGDATRDSSRRRSRF
jgi:8-oxo-dGTP pyrophosphatase MutT (NUDIX family)